MVKEKTREISLEDIIRKGQKENTLFASGTITEDVLDVRGCINLSSMLSELIHQAVGCIAYASDLFFLWEQVLRSMNEKKCGISSYLFGFRETGIDGLEEVLAFLGSNADKLDKVYNSIYRMDVAIGSFNLYGEAYIRVSLYPVGIREEA